MMAGQGPHIGLLIQSVVAPWKQQWRFASPTNLFTELRRIVRASLQWGMGCRCGFSGTLQDAWRTRFA